jgi:hypothetical protein
MISLPVLCTLVVNFCTWPDQLSPIVFITGKITRPILEPLYWRILLILTPVQGKRRPGDCKERTSRNDEDYRISPSWPSWGEYSDPSMGKPQEAFSRPTVFINDLPAHLISASSELIVAQVPADARSGKLWLTLEDEESNSLPIEIARLLASDLHPVANPALDSSGSIYTTLSGRRGEKVGNSVFRVDASGKVQDGHRFDEPTLALTAKVNYSSQADTTKMSTKSPHLGRKVFIPKEWE